MYKFSTLLVCIAMMAALMSSVVLGSGITNHPGEGHAVSPAASNPANL